MCTANLARHATMERGGDLGSDHFPMVTTFGVQIEKANLITNKKWKIKDADWEKFEEKLEQESEDYFIQPTDVDTCNKVLTKRIYGAAEQIILLLFLF